jgi:ElaB/YqjD/DUF883 family membrane-anchored ribosome-binding protein
MTKPSEISGNRKSGFRPTSLNHDNNSTSEPSILTGIASEYPEFSDIREDMKSLRDDVVKLTKHVRTDGSKQLKDYATSKLNKIEQRVTEKPGQSVAVAFVAGMAAWFLLARRG